MLLAFHGAFLTGSKEQTDFLSGTVANNYKIILQKDLPVRVEETDYPRLTEGNE